MFFGCSQFDCDLSGWDISVICNTANAFSKTPIARKKSKQPKRI
jgi:hypothetical protein